MSSHGGVGIATGSVNNLKPITDASKRRRGGSLGWGRVVDLAIDQGNDFTSLEISMKNNKGDN